MCKETIDGLHATHNRIRVHHWLRLFMTRSERRRSLLKNATGGPEVKYAFGVRRHSVEPVSRFFEHAYEGSIL
jgi:hypothetical protein